MKKVFISIIVVFILLYILPLGVRPIMIPDETRYAEIPREMLATRDWIVPHLNSLRYFEKPVLGYWLNAASILLFGENAFAIRFPSAMSVGISAIMVFFLVRRFEVNCLSGFLAAAALLTCLEVYGVGTFSVLDSIFSFFVTGTMFFFFLAYMSENHSKKKYLSALSGIFMGFAFLTKGFIAFVVPMSGIIPFIIWERRPKDIIRIGCLMFATAVLIPLPWSIAIYLHEPDFWHYFFWVEHVGRFISPTGGQHPQPFWYFVPVIFGGALPWTALLPAAILGLQKTCFRNKEVASGNRPSALAEAAPLTLIRYTLCWFIFPFLFFSVSNGKISTYILPCFPPFVIFVTIGLFKYLKNGKRQVFNLCLYFLAILISIFAVILVVSQTTNTIKIIAYSHTEIWKWLVLTAGLLVWAVFLIVSARTLDFKKKLWLFCAGPLIFMISLPFIVPNQIKEKKAPGKFLLRYCDRVKQGTVVVSNELVPAACWFYHRNNIYVLEDASELQYGLTYAEAKHRLLKIDQLKTLISKSQGKGNIILITKTDHYLRYKQYLPKPVFEESNRYFVFAQFCQIRGTIN